MPLHFYKPHPLLCDIVHSTIIIQEDFNPANPFPIGLFPPVPDHSLQFYPREGVLEHKLDGRNIIHGKSIVVPSCTQRIDLSLPYQYTCIRVGFQPGGLYRLLNLPMHKILDNAFDGEEIFGNQIKDVNDQLQKTQDFDAMNNLVEIFLLSHKGSRKIAIDNNANGTAQRGY